MSASDHPVDVSVVIAAYNAAPFIERAVTSALAQSGIAIEVIVVDDASTDDTLAIVRRLVETDARIRSLTLPLNSGPSAARNAGIEAARGDWIAVLDADDAFEPGRLSWLVGEARARQADIAADNFRYFHPGRETTSKPAVNFPDAVTDIDLHLFLDRARPRRDGADWGLLKPIFRRGFLEEKSVRYPASQRHAEDFRLIIECLLKGARYIGVNRPGYLYTHRTAGWSRTSIDYDAVINRTDDLFGIPELAADPAAARLLGLRKTALSAYKREYEVRRLVSRRDLGALAVRLRENPGSAVILAKVIVDYMRFHTGRLVERLAGGARSP